jgi:malonyl-CoA/methylmalonyl-CoA synthetase
MTANGNLYCHFEASFAEAGARPAFHLADGRTLSYGELSDRVASAAGALRQMGVRPGERVTVQVEKSIGNVVLYLAVLKAGAVYQPLNSAYTDAEVDYFLRDAEPALLVADPRRAALQPLARASGVRRVETLDQKGEGTYADHVAAAHPEHRTVEVGGDDLAGLLYTSGTTGRSKGAMLTHRNLASNARALHRIWRFEPGDVLLHALPIFHVHGLYVALNTSFLGATGIIWRERFDAAEVAAALPRASVFMGVPTFYTRLLASPALSADCCRAMRLFISGSAPLLAETHRAFEERTGHRILERYGMTETGMIASNPCDGERLPGTVGYALPDVSVRIADAEGREIARGEPGVLEVKGPNVFTGYWRRPDLAASEFRRDGYFITGDVATMAADGRVSIVGRAKDLIISGGFNVYPKEVEEELDRMPGVGESAVFGVAHPDFGEGVVAVVVPGGRGALPNEAEIIAALSERLARFKVPKRVMVETELPRNAMGKVQKAALRARHAELFRG